MLTMAVKEVLGKGVVACHDTPGFIANRIGVYWLQCAVSEAIVGGVGGVLILVTSYRLRVTGYLEHK